MLELIRRWRLCKPLIAAKMSMNINTFGNKLNHKLTKYKFSEEEIGRLRAVLQELQNDLNEVLTKSQGHE